MTKASEKDWRIPPCGRREALGGGRHAASSSVASAVWPVSPRKTSSSVGRRSAMSSMAIPASSRSRTTCARAWAPPLAGHGQLAGVLVERRLAVAVPAHDLGGPGDVVTLVDDDLDPRAAEVRLEFVGRAAGDDLAVVDDGDRVGQFVGLLEVLRRQEQGRALADQAADDVPHAEAAARVEPGRRLVEEQQLGPPDERAAKVEPAAHAARVRLDDPVAGVGQLELLQQLRCASRGLGLRELVQPPEHDQVLAPGQVLVDRGVLPGQADDRAKLLRLLDDVEARDRGVAGVRLQQRREDAHGRGLAGPVRAEQSQDRAFGDLEVHAVECADLVLAGPIDLDEAFGGDGVHGGAQPRVRYLGAAQYTEVRCARSARGQPWRSFRIRSAASLPGAPMTQPPGCVPEPHW